MPFEGGAHDAIDQDLRHRMISEAAYRLYAERGYADGYDLDDWLEAEAQVDHVTTGSSGGTAADAEPAEMVDS
jgi:predicted acyl esterase